MLIVLSPAKTLDFESRIRTRKATSPQFLDDSERLVTVMQKKRPRQLKALMGISDALAELNHERFQNWTRAHGPDNARQAVHAFMGDVYTGLDAATLNARDLGWAQERLRILSGLYGLLRPLDLMQPYRLEMGTALKNTRGKDLYRFWGKRPALALNEQAAALGTQHLVNLASNEYFNAVDKKRLDLSIVAPTFKDYSNGQYRVLSFFAKKARGMMARYIIQNRLTDPADLAAFDSDGYRYDPKSSTPEKPVFLRRNS